MLLFMISALALVLYPVLLWRRVTALRDPVRRRPLSALEFAEWTGTVVFPASFLFLAWRMWLDTSSSTSVLALLVAPALAAGASLLAAGLVWSVVVVAGRVVQPPGADSPSVFRLASALAVIALVSAGAVLMVRAELEFQRAQSASSEELWQVYRRPGALTKTWLMAALAANPRTPPEVLLELARADRPSYGRPQSGIGPFLRGQTRSVWRALVNNSAASSEVLTALAERAPPRVVAEVARHPRASEDLLRRLAASGSTEVLRTLVRNPALPPELLAGFRDHSDPWVRSGVAYHPSTPPEVLRGLAEDPDPSVRRAVAASPQVSRETLERLSTDDDERVRQDASRRLLALR